MKIKNKKYSMKKSLLIIKLGSTYPEISYIFGDFDKWIINELDENIVWNVLDVFNVIPEELYQYDGVILTGSHQSLVQPYPYLKGVERLLDNIVEYEIPTLGICFGHQLINKIFGGKIIRNPLGMELGISNIQLTVDGLADTIFGALSPGLQKIFACHTDIVLEPGKDMVSLAWNDFSQYQVTRYRNYIYTVQFHPEFNINIMHAYINKFMSLKHDNFAITPFNIQSAKSTIRMNKNPNNYNIVLKNFYRLIQNQNVHD